MRDRETHRGLHVWKLDSRRIKVNLTNPQRYYGGSGGGRNGTSLTSYAPPHFAHIHDTPNHLICVDPTPSMNVQATDSSTSSSHFAPRLSSLDTFKEQPYFGTTSPHTHSNGVYYHSHLGLPLVTG